MRKIWIFSCFCVKIGCWLKNWQMLRSVLEKLHSWWCWVVTVQTAVRSALPNHPSLLDSTGAVFLPAAPTGPALPVCGAAYMFVLSIEVLFQPDRSGCVFTSVLCWISPDVCWWSAIRRGRAPPWPGAWCRELWLFTTRSMAGRASGSHVKKGPR